MNIIILFIKQLAFIFQFYGIKRPNAGQGVGMLAVDAAVRYF